MPYFHYAMFAWFVFSASSSAWFKSICFDSPIEIPFHILILGQFSESPKEIGQPRNLRDPSLPPHHNGSSNPA